MEGEGVGGWELERGMWREWEDGGWNFDGADELVEDKDDICSLRY